MFTRCAVVFLGSVSLAACSPTTSAAPPPAEADAVVETTALVGAFHGTLTYKDYSSGKSTTITAVANAAQREDAVVIDVSYPKEPGHEETIHLQRMGVGFALEGAPLQIRTRPDASTLRLVFERPGVDGNDARPCTLRHVLDIRSARFSLAKYVRFDGEANFFERHVYRFER